MNKLGLLVLIFFIQSSAYTQQKAKKLGISIEYGLQGNFFVRSYDEQNTFASTSFYKKRFLGRIASAELSYKIAKNTNLVFAFSNTINKREIDYRGTSIGVFIKDFEITHMGNAYQLYIDKAFSKKKSEFRYFIGLIYHRTNQQEIDIDDRIGGGVSFDERSYKYNKLEEGGFVFGLHYQKKIDNKFYFGVKSRIFYLASANTLEGISLTPTLTYIF